MPKVRVLPEAGSLPLRCRGEVHRGKVRSVYWLDSVDSQRLCERYGCDLGADPSLGVMVISDRLSAFDCHWIAEGEMDGVPGKGAALNAIAAHWFQRFAEEGLGPHHIVAAPHPLVWIVQRAQPILVEAIARQYITGSMWRAYEKGEREFGGERLSDGLRSHQKLNTVLFTPTTKGVISEVPGVPPLEDTPVTRACVAEHFAAFGLAQREHLEVVESRMRDGFALIANELAGLGYLFVDTKFEFGYGRGPGGAPCILYMDEVGTPDSSRIWDADAYAQGRLVDYCKEPFRQFLLRTLDRDLLTDGSRMEERKALAASYRVPMEEMLAVATRYQHIAAQITGRPLRMSERPREELLDVLAQLGLLK